MNTSAFSGPCGNDQSATSTTGLQVNTAVLLNGNIDLSTCMTANDGGCVYGITLTGDPGLYDYQLNIDAQGPSGFGSGSMYLAFTDQTGDTYKIFIFSKKRSTHTLAYNSKQPAIMKIQWSNHSIG